MEVVVSRICEEFGCLPTAALRELEEAPHGLVADVIDVRGFTRTKEALDRATPGSKIEPPTGPMSDRVWAAIAAIEADKKKVHEEMLRGAGDVSR